MKRVLRTIAYSLILALLLCACGSEAPENTGGKPSGITFEYGDFDVPGQLSAPPETEKSGSITESDPSEDTEPETVTPDTPAEPEPEKEVPMEKTDGQTDMQTGEEKPAEPEKAPEKAPEEPAPEAQDSEPAPAAPQSSGGGKLIVIDAGHQSRANTEKEPIGPGSSEMKMKVTGGTTGKTTGLTEYQLNLDVALKLEKELTARGYRVIQCRTTNEVNMSNSERAAIANDNNADAFVRIHANGSDNTGAHGMMTICQTANNPYNASLHDVSKKLSTCILDAAVAATGAKREYVWETDTMSGVNWAKVPVTIIEMGYMSNPDEDRLMATEDYQNKIATGIANGIDAFFAG